MTNCHCNRELLCCHSQDWCELNDSLDYQYWASWMSVVKNFTFEHSFKWTWMTLSFFVAYLVHYVNKFLVILSNKPINNIRFVHQHHAGVKFKTYYSTHKIGFHTNMKVQIPLKYYHYFTSNCRLVMVSRLGKLILKIAFAPNV